jgi:hypothetical protein
MKRRKRKYPLKSRLNGEKNCEQCGKLVNFLSLDCFEAIAGEEYLKGILVNGKP